jgi:membrane protein DedA with SNARE-associated domain
MMTTSIFTIVLGTFVSEDLTCISTGLLIQEGVLDWWPGLLGCFAGIYVGDLGLWLLGRLFGRRLLDWSWIAPERVRTLGRWFDERGWIAILATRFLPGTRLPLYVGAGMLGRDGWRFAWWTFLAALAWTPLLVVGVALVGPEVVALFQRWIGVGWISLLAAAGLLFFLLKLVPRLAHREGRAKLLSKIAKIWHWEFWPTWLFYLPVLPWIIWLMVRYRSFTVWTAANPGIPHGGVVGESKNAILAQLPVDATLPFALLAPGTIEERMQCFEDLLRERHWEFPLILKPDVGQRGDGVKLTHHLDDVAAYLAKQSNAIVVQTYHPGPFEAGVFYVRVPGQSAGRIFSITDKRFPMLMGDGCSTIEEFIWAHPRYRLQAEVFLARHEKERKRVLGRGDTFRLAIAGNHSQGTLFLDGAELITSELERRIDEIAKHFDGFFFGRFDMRYSDVDAFKAGKDIAIVELNGVTSESTNLYDPRRSLFSAYRILFEQWAILFRIGEANRRLGFRPTPLMTLVRLMSEHFFERRPSIAAD